jgi:AbrB family looped-hinge helix DNA binding protein
MSQKLVEMAANGRLVIPAVTRAELGLTEAERFVVTVEDGSIVLTPVALVPVDRTFPITPELVAAANRAAADPGHRLSRAEMRDRLARLAT